MARLSQKPVFVDHKAYRQRRLRDVARMLPVLAAILWLLPLAWRDGIGGTATTVIYIFAVWLTMIALTALVSARLRPSAETDGPDDRAR